MIHRQRSVIERVEADEDGGGKRTSGDERNDPHQDVAPRKGMAQRGTTRVEEPKEERNEGKGEKCRSIEETSDEDDGERQSAGGGAGELRRGAGGRGRSGIQRRRRRDREFETQIQRGIFTALINRMRRNSPVAIQLGISNPRRNHD